MWFNSQHQADPSDGPQKRQQKSYPTKCGRLYGSHYAIELEQNEGVMAHIWI